MILRLSDGKGREVAMEMPDEMYKALAHPSVPESFDDGDQLQRFLAESDEHTSALEVALSQFMEPALLALAGFRPETEAWFKERGL